MRKGALTAETTTIDITRATPTDVPTLSGALARAFHDDPVFAWLVPGPVARRERLPSLFAAFVELFLPHEETYVAAGGAGGALWAPFGVEVPAPEQAEAFGERLAAILEEDAERGLALQARLDEHHPEQPCFHLQFLGVVPGHQGRGLGSRLLATVLRRCDASGVPAYLEATSPHNRRLYERHGFAAVTELTLPDGPPMWPMWREPAA